MTTSIRLLAICAAALALAGCNAVYSEKPLFTPADAAGAAILRPGLWRAADQKCRVNEARPVQRWPACAGWMLIRPGQVLGYDSKAKPPAWSSTDYVLASGDPRIVQIPNKSDTGLNFEYAGLRSLRQDSDGRIVEVKYWAVLCGPPPKPKPAEEAASAKTGAKPSNAADVSTPAASGTQQSWPGLEIRDDNCFAHDQASLRGAAAASEAFDTDPTTVHWVRDTLP